MYGNNTPRKYDTNANKSISSNIGSSPSVSHFNMSGSLNNRTGVRNMTNFPYPVSWYDYELMQILMGPIQRYAINREYYELIMNFWQNMIGMFCEHMGCACFNKRQLLTAFERHKRLPQSLDLVLEEMLRVGAIQLRSDYEQQQSMPENSWKGWAINSFVKRPLSWGMSKLPLIGGGGATQTDAAAIQYVHVEAVDKFCRELQAKVIAQQADQILHFDTLKELVDQHMQICSDTLCVCLRSLHHGRRIGLEYLKDDHNNDIIHLVKIPGKNDPNPDISETNRAVHNLQMTQRNLMKQLEQIEEDIKLNEDKARQYLKEGKRQLAKTYLRKKQLLEKSHDKRSIALHNVETLLCSVDDAKSNGEIMDAYKIGSKALQNMLNASGLKYDNVDEVIADVRDTMDTHNEVQETLATSGVADSMMIGDEDALEQELKQIMGEDAEFKQRAAGGAATVAKQAAATSTKPAAVNAAPQNATVHQIEISDAELLAMLDSLEDVEMNSPAKTMRMASVQL